jgi:hypothetical protein
MSTLALTLRVSKLLEEEEEGRRRRGGRRRRRVYMYCWE